MHLRQRDVYTDRAFRNTVSLVVAALLCAVSGESPGIGAARLAAFQSATILSVTLSPTTVAGGSGDTAIGTVTLTGPAPTGGAVVTLTSSNLELAATMPTLTVPAGATSATFSIGTNARYRAYSALA